MSFAATANATLPARRKRRRPSLTSIAPASDARLRRELFAEVDKGAVAEWAVKIIEKFAEQFAALSDGYLKERGRSAHAGPAAAFPSR